MLCFYFVQFYFQLSIIYNKPFFINFFYNL
nr:MAG TPA: hypothetical protein [Caudoviricetes sp.]